MVMSSVLRCVPVEQEGHFQICPAVPADTAVVVEDLAVGGRGAGVQAREEGSHTIADRRHPA